MGDLGSYIWFIGLGAGIVILAIAMIYARSRRRQTYVAGDPNHAWKQAAAVSSGRGVRGQLRRTIPFHMPSI